MFERFKRLVFLPVLVSNLYSMYGVLFLQWSVADLFFWFWSEFVFMGVTTFVLTLYWVQTEKTLHRGVLKNSPFLFLFAFLAVLFYATMFAALAYKGEWKSWDLFPQFLADKEIGLIATFISFVVFFGMTIIKKNHGYEDSEKVMFQFGRKSWVIIGLYLVLMLQYHFTGARQLNLTPGYLECMGMVLLVFKLLAELGILDRLVHRQSKQM